ncbi:SDR family NAD(P)-dependent oxidoreductase [Hymenobacter caeli]|uniref:NAD(P)-dependent dehydrogenase (Short-subunit alcohol dehydrogenase family) n=1 Tax=Hymenobacter caeli TaxID=2735894 RepID=A0ABX2FUG1_9BACT|nr:SDR family oxidoreductase [Hymenobacter caeli]NRT20815.1 NAD(P)-dependent dehydrogenase (short-subunit alcohol dehydrogenase family) [Hymenobacter caeli]
MTSNLFDLTGKVALVTGASSGMGQAIALAMGQHGATVVVSGNDAAACAATVQDFAGQGITTLAVSCDMGDPAQVQQLADTALAQFGRVDVLVSCVGVAPVGSVLDLDANDFERTMALNLQSAMYLTKLLVPQMVARQDGALIYLASIAGVRGNRSIGLYGVSKAALMQLARNLAVEFGPANIRANTISPGVIETAFARPMLESPEVMAKRLAATPLRRVGQPEEVAGVAVLLASQAGGFITGQNLVVDGGTVISDGN